MSKSNEQEALSGSADPAQPLAGPHAAGLRHPATQALVALHGRCVAVELRINGHTVVVQGMATYDSRGELQIRLDDEAKTEIHIAESTWNGRIVPDTEHGNDFRIVLDAKASFPQAAG
jgi:hypothetical protein